MNMDQHTRPVRQPDEVGANLGRLIVLDERDAEYPARPYLSALDPSSEALEALERGYRYWWADGWWGDQWYTSECVSYMWLHLLEDGPITYEPLTPQREAQHNTGTLMEPRELYNAAQRIDEWPGEDYEGTSVRAGAKVLQSRGLISSYRWLYTVEEVADALLRAAPVCVGTMWTEDMFYPDDEGYIVPDGRDAGGHAYLLNGVNVHEETFRIKNSWGRGWAINGHGRIRFEHMQTLLDNWGEACIATEVQ